MSGESSKSFDACWRLSPQAQLHWKNWGDESVVFDARSGDTHLLDVVGREGLLCLERSILSSTQLSEALSQRLDIENDSDLLRYSEQLIEEFDKLGLLERGNP